MRGLPTTISNRLHAAIRRCLTASIATEPDQVQSSEHTSAVRSQRDHSSWTAVMGCTACAARIWAGLTSAQSQVPHLPLLHQLLRHAMFNLHYRELVSAMFSGICSDGGDFAKDHTLPFSTRRRDVAVELSSHGCTAALWLPVDGANAMQAVERRLHASCGRNSATCKSQQPTGKGLTEVSH